MFTDKIKSILETGRQLDTDREAENPFLNLVAS
jgi:hypothetical protein